jgi:hypothetical protein
MTRTISRFSWCILLLCCPGALAQVVYDNLAPANWSLAYPNAADVKPDQFGDEITLASGSSTTLSTFSLQCYGQGLSGDETVQVHFYDNSGPEIQGALSPAEPAFYSTAVLPITNGKQVVTFDNLNVVVPDHFTWAVQFSGVTGSEVAGVAVHGPATIGSSQVGGADDFWENLGGGGGWTLYAFTGSTPSSFGAQITAVPEPKAYALATALGLLGLVICRRYRLSAVKSD